MSAKPQIKLYVDIVSPFGYLAFYALRVRVYLYYASSCYRFRVLSCWSLRESV